MNRVAIYTRFSTSQQREASTEGQARNCRRRIEAEGWQLIEHFKDEAISGTIIDRPGYQRLLRAAEAGVFDVLMVDDLSRLSRDQVESERTIRRLEFRGLRIIGVSDGYDSASKSRKVQRGIRGLMNELYLDDLRDKTHRGLAGQALKKYWAGGKPYGYRLVQVKDETRIDSYGNALVIGTSLEVHPEQAEIVREIFRRYADDLSQREIAAQLNARGVPSPGSAWRGRTIRRASGWLGSTINALLANQLYRGRYAWNKTAWIKNPDTGQRTTRSRPDSEHVVHDMPELRIIDEALYRRMLERRQRAAIRGAAVREGLARSLGQTGRGGPKFAFSGLLRCEICDSSMVIIGGTQGWRAYGCSGNKFGGASVCSNDLSVRKELLEARLVEPIKRDLRAPTLLADLQARVVQRIAARPKPHDQAPRIAVLQNQITNLTDAIATGALRSSPALAQRLTEVEAELTHVRSQIERPLPHIVDFPTRLSARIGKLVDTLERYLDREPHRARAAIREIVGPVIPVRPHVSGRFLVARIGLSGRLVMAAAGFERFVVAGA
jgi:DNA invertase Pin-like site-specific DNA recombinase